VLLVEGDQQVRRLVELLLADGRHRVVGAGSGTEALGILADSARACDLVVTDMVLADMRGDEIVRRARGLRGRLPVICVSGSAAEMVAENGTAPDAFLAKPFTGDELLAAIRAALPRDGVTSSAAAR
jgi:DNA-binding response OmpR family regulator